jgi:type IV secretory pathway VirB10-like protein
MNGPSKRWPLLAAGGAVLLVFGFGFAWLISGIAHAMSHVTVAQSSPSPDPPEPAFTVAPVAEVAVSMTTAEPVQTAFPQRPVRAVASLFLPATPKPAGCCVRASFRSVQPRQGAQTQAGAPPSPAPVIVHKLEDLNFGNVPNAPQAAPQPVASIPSSYALPTATPNAQSRYVIPSQYEISDTDFVRVKLVTEVRSEVPGEVVGVITRPILDSATHSVELIPAGSTVHGDDDHANLAQGQGRLGIDWYEIILPNTISLPIGKQKSADTMGAGGVAGNVDTHEGRAFGKFVMYTLVGALGNAIGRVSYLGGSSIGSQFASSAQDIKPTITIPANTDVDIYLSGPIADLRPWSEVSKWHK